MDIILNVLNQTLVFTVPLLVVALGGMFSERSGVVNIALEGIMSWWSIRGGLFHLFNAISKPNNESAIIIDFSINCSWYFWGSIKFTSCFCSN